MLGFEPKRMSQTWFLFTVPCCSYLDSIVLWMSVRLFSRTQVRTLWNNKQSFASHRASLVSWPSPFLSDHHQWEQWQSQCHDQWPRKTQGPHYGPLVLFIWNCSDHCPWDAQSPGQLLRENVSQCSILVTICTHSKNKWSILADNLTLRAQCPNPIC